MLLTHTREAVILVVRRGQEMTASRNTEVECHPLKDATSLCALFFGEIALLAVEAPRGVITALICARFALVW